MGGAQFTQMSDEISVLRDFQGVAMQSHDLPDLVLAMVLFQARVWANTHQRSLPTNTSVTPYQGARGSSWADICNDFPSILAQTSYILCLKDLIEWKEPG